MPPFDGLVYAASTPSPVSSSVFAGLTGPIVPDVFGVDQLSLTIILGLVALFGLLVLCLPATGDFFRHLVMLLFFFLGAFCVITAQNLVAFVGAWEITCLFAWGIGQLANGADEVRDGVVPFRAAGALGSFAMLLGLVLFGLSRHSLLLNLSDDPAVQPGFVPFLILIALILKTYGLLSEGWDLRPGRGFTLAGAVLAGAGVLAVGLYPFFRFFGALFATTDGWRTQTIWIMGALAVLAALAALVQVDYRRALAYGAFSQFCLMAAVYATGIPIAALGAVIGSVANALAFTGLFVGVSGAEEATAQVLIQRVGGLAPRLPLTTALFVLCAAALVGLPGLGGFAAARLIGTATASSPTLPLLWLLVIGLTLLYLAKLFTSLFLGEPRGPVRAERRWPTLVATGGVVGTLLLVSAAATDVVALLTH